MLILNLCRFIIQSTYATNYAREVERVQTRIISIFQGKNFKQILMLKFQNGSNVISTILFKIDEC